MRKKHIFENKKYKHIDAIPKLNYIIPKIKADLSLHMEMTTGYWEKLISSETYPSNAITL